MGVEPSAPDRPTRFKPMTLALAGVGVLAAWTALLPKSILPENFAAIGAVALFAAARLGFRPGLVVLAVALGVKDVGVYLTRGLDPYPLSWLCFSVYAVLGWAFLRNTESPVRIGTTAVAGSLVFFLTTNFLSWLDQSLPYGYSFAGLVDCYRGAIPFYRGTFAGDLFYGGVLFGLHAVLSRAYFPAERPALQTEAVR
ncbi:MAG: hypothetical protein JWO38_6431 [Gemmataceae bacterium]|nr:hypothetical protein [Gemmataceae bacterium]